jgi:adenine-specific DNA-methyltransferase
MAEDLKATGKGNLFVIFGEPDIDLIREKDGKLRVKVKGVDVFKPQTGEAISDKAIWGYRAFRALLADKRHDT